MKDLCKAMGIEWHEFLTAKEATYPMECRCGRPLTKANHRNPSPTDPAFCWRALQWLRSNSERWDSFTFYAKEEWGPDEWEQKRIRRDFTEWLLDPARFIELADEWCREHKEVKP